MPNRNVEGVRVGGDEAGQNVERNRILRPVVLFQENNENNKGMYKQFLL